jgi:hypothetical protein
MRRFLENARQDGSIVGYNDRKKRWQLHKGRAAHAELSREIKKRYPRRKPLQEPWDSKVNSSPRRVAFGMHVSRKNNEFLCTEGKMLAWRDVRSQNRNKSVGLVEVEYTDRSGKKRIETVFAEHVFV